MVIIAIYFSMKKKLLSLKQSLGNISTDFDIGHMLNTGLVGYIYDFSVDYRAISNDEILDIHKYLMKKSNIV